MLLSLNNTFMLLSKSVGSISASSLVDECRKLGMEEQPYFDIGLDSRLPDFDKGFKFIYKTNGNQDVFFEILAKDNVILQAGFQIIYSFDPFNKMYDKHYRELLGLLENYYGDGLPMGAGNIELINYGNAMTVCYIFKSKINNRNAITLRIGNREIWDTAQVKLVNPQDSMNKEKAMGCEKYLMKNLRMMVEISPFQKKWITLEEEVFGITSVTDKVDWKKLNEKGKSLLREVTDIVVHYGEDRGKIFKEADEKNLKILEPFLRQSFIYIDVLNRTIMKLAFITNHLYKMTIEPGSWSAKEYLMELDQYKSLCDEYHKEGDAMNKELDRIRNVMLKIE